MGGERRRAVFSPNHCILKKLTTFSSLFLFLAGTQPVAKGLAKKQRLLLMLLLLLLFEQHGDGQYLMKMTMTQKKKKKN